MAVYLDINTDFYGEGLVKPRDVRVITDASRATAIAAGFLLTNGFLQFYDTDFVTCIYDYDSATDSGTLEQFTVSVDGDDIPTLVPFVPTGDVLLPVVDGHFANFNGTTGQIEDAGYLPSDATKTRVVMANGATVANEFATFADVTGTAKTSGFTPTDGTKTKVVMASGATVVGNFPEFLDVSGTIQDSGISPSDATKTKAVMANAASVVGQIPKYTDTAGTIGTIGASVIAATTAAYAGGGTSNAYVATGLTASSIVTAVILASTNAVSIAKAVPSANTLTVTFSADPGADTTVNYIAFSGAAS